MAKQTSNEPTSSAPKPARRILPLVAGAAAAAIAVGLFLLSGGDDSSHDTAAPQAPDGAFAAHVGEHLPDRVALEGEAPGGAAPENTRPDALSPDNNVSDKEVPDNEAPEAAGSASPQPAGATDDALPPPAATLTREEVLEGIEAFRPVVGRCYEDVLGEFPEAEGRVIVEFDIVARGGEGLVELAELGEGTTLFDNHLHDCMLESLGDVSFPTPSGDGTVRVRYPFNFVAESD